MSYTMTRRYFPAGYVAGNTVGTVDISDASDTTQFTWTPQEVVWVYGFGGICTEATGTQSTTAGVGSLVLNGTEVSTITAGISRAIGTEVLGTDFKPVKILAGQVVIIKTKTLAVGGTIVGEYAAFIECEFFPATDAS